MSKHSPSPWRLRLSSVIAADGYEVGCIWKGDSPSDKPKDDANARLIAAAPDLLAALRVLVAGDESDRKSGLRLYQNGSPRDKTWGSARAAIANAEGDQS